MNLPRCAFRASSSIGKSQFLPMTSAARFFSVHGHSFVVEQIAAEFDLRGAHRIIGGNRGPRESFGQTPLEIGARQTRRDSESDSDTPKQPACLFPTCHTRRVPLTSGAAWPSARRPGTP